MTYGWCNRRQCLGMRKDKGARCDRAGRLIAEIMSFGMDMNSIE